MRMPTIDWTPERVAISFKKRQSGDERSSLVPIREALRGGQAFQQQRSLLPDGRTEVLSKDGMKATKRAMYPTRSENSCSSTTYRQIDLNDVVVRR